MRHLKVVVGTLVYIAVVFAIVAYLQASLRVERFEVDAASTAAGTTTTFVATRDVNANNVSVAGELRVQEKALMVDAQGNVRADAVQVGTLDISGQATIDGQPIATVAQLQAVQQNIRGPQGPQGPIGLTGPAGQQGANGAQGPPGYNDPNAKFDSIRLGDKFRMSGVGDALGNDDWLRLLNKDGTGYRGGLAAQFSWTGEHTWMKNANISGHTNFRGGTSRHNPGNWATHLPWSENNKNYIRGDTEIRGDTNNIGDLTVGGKLRTTESHRCFNSATPWSDNQVGNNVNRYLDRLSKQTCPDNTYVNGFYFDHDGTQRMRLVYKCCKFDKN